MVLTDTKSIEKKYRKGVKMNWLEFILRVLQVLIESIDGYEEKTDNLDGKHWLSESNDDYRRQVIRVLMDCHNNLTIKQSKWR
jgi:hypothetical protein